MGILDRFFKSDSEGDKEGKTTGLPWEMLESIEQFHNIVANSSKKPKVIFKHSTRCGISRMVLKNFENGYTLNNGVAGFYLLDLLNHREISNEIASELNVSHQSPQLIILRNQQVLHTESHHGIDIHKVEELINNNL